MTVYCLCGSCLVYIALEMPLYASIICSFICALSLRNDILLISVIFLMLYESIYNYLLLQFYGILYQIEECNL